LSGAANGGRACNFHEAYPHGAPWGISGAPRAFNATRHGTGRGAAMFEYHGYGGPSATCRRNEQDHPTP